MRIRRLYVQNFRGLKKLDWILPDNQKLFVLLGAGDSCKTTILKAIEYLLTDRWNLSISDSDFTDLSVEQPILIKAVLTDLPSALLKDNTFGFYMKGIDSTGEVYEDPVDGCTECLVMQLRIAADLEPHWSICKGDNEVSISSSQRRLFGVFTVDNRINAQLRWSRISALGKLSKNNGQFRNVLQEAARSAQESITTNKNRDLKDLTAKIQDELNSIGAGTFSALQAGLDVSQNSLGAGLALYEDDLPLSTLGLGSKRLAGLAVQQYAMVGKSIVLVDEIEYGLEPHRIVRLIKRLEEDEKYSQVFITTHSPIVVEQVPLGSMAVVRRHGEQEDIHTEIHMIPQSNAVFQKMRRSKPSSLLAKRVLVCEGKTEYGVMKRLIEAWDAERENSGMAVSASHGFALVDGNGDTQSVDVHTQFLDLGYNAALLVDADSEKANAKIRERKYGFSGVFQWQQGKNTEQQCIGDLPVDKLLELCAIHIGEEEDKKSRENNLIAELCQQLGIRKVSSLNECIDESSFDAVRQTVASLANKRKWFKDIEKGELLGQFLLQNRKLAELSYMWQIFVNIYLFVYEEG